MMLCDAKKLRELGYSTWFIKGVKRAGKAFGDNPFIGRYAYKEDIEAWLHKHPDFVASHTLRSKPPSPGKDYQKPRGHGQKPKSSKRKRRPDVEFDARRIRFASLAGSCPDLPDVPTHTTRDLPHGESSS